MLQRDESRLFGDMHRWVAYTAIALTCDQQRPVSCFHFHTIEKRHSITYDIETSRHRELDGSPRSSVPFRLRNAPEQVDLRDDTVRRTRLDFWWERRPLQELQLVPGRGLFRFGVLLAAWTTRGFCSIYPLDIVRLRLFHDSQF